MKRHLIEPFSHIGKKYSESEILHINKKKEIRKIICVKGLLYIKSHFSKNQHRYIGFDNFIIMDNGNLTKGEIK